MKKTFVQFLVLKLNVPFFFIVLAFAGLPFSNLFAQSLKFNHVLGADGDTDPYLAIAQDKYGTIWVTRQIKGLQRYDGRELKSYLHDPQNVNSPASNYIESLIIDSSNIFWLGTYGEGLDRFDPASNTYTHYKHNPADPFSISSDSITALLSDRSGNLWVGSHGGLDLLDKKTGRFTHFRNNPADPQSLSFNEVRIIYEDKQGSIWVGCGRPFTNTDQVEEDGGLNRLDKLTGKFTRYLHNPADPTSIENNKVRAIFEDSKGNFWVGTLGDGLQTLDRNTGKFTHYHYDKKNPGSLSRPSQININGKPSDHIPFITEDATGSILIGSYSQGINYYNPIEKKLTHYGISYTEDEVNYLDIDTATGLTQGRLWKIFTSREGLTWITTLGGYVFTIAPLQTIIPYYTLNASLPDVNGIYVETGSNIAWFATMNGLFRQDLKTGEQKVWKHDPRNANSLSNDSISSIKADDKGNLWMATNDGLCRYNKATNTFKTWRHDPTNPKSISENSLNYVFIDSEKNIWIGTSTNGADRFNVNTNEFVNFGGPKNKKNFNSSYIMSISEDKEKNIWLASNYGLNKLNPSSGTISYYLPNFEVPCVFTDAAGEIWTCNKNSLFRYDRKNDLFISFMDPNRKQELRDIINIVEDKERNLWLSTASSIIKINDKRDELRIFGAVNGVHTNGFGYADNFVGSDGKVYMGDESGYYAFTPDLLQDKNSPPVVLFTSLKVDDKEILPGSRILNTTLAEAKVISLNYDQNNFSFEFSAISYIVPGEKKYLFKLENYDEDWHYTGSEQKAYFYNIPPGEYILHVKGIATDGSSGEKTLTIIITPPWWRTWWAYTLFALLAIVCISTFIAWRSRKLKLENKILEEKVLHRTAELNHSLENLKATQAQLIQSEKMASLGELTAGIAHEIQNPLNFVNNFSEINNELIEELKSQKSKLKSEEQDEILNDIFLNNEKINHHGKRADSIVKGMLQHSRKSSGEKEPTDINALADEYLKLSYHGLRAKDKSFNATMKTQFDPSIGKIGIISQDIGRVLLNLYNNAFYAVNERKKSLELSATSYEPIVSVSTNKINGKIELKVSDNGNGIPPSAIDKIFQPFFTTKPTGQGTGLGLSLAYDIVKAHGGELKVSSGPNKETVFSILLPA